MAESRPDPLRRRVRTSLLEGLSRAAGGPLEPVLGATLGLASKAARWSRFEHVALTNLRLAMPELAPSERRRIASGVRAHAARLVLEWAKLARAQRGERERSRTLDWLERTVDVDGSLAIAREVRSHGRGVLIVTAHLGNWELLAARVRQLGFPGAVVGFRRRRDPSSDWLVRMRQGLDVETIAQSRAARRALEVLRSGHTLGLLADLEAKRIAGVEAPLFGRNVPTLTAPAALARAAGCLVLPAFCVAQARGYRLCFEAPLALDPTLGKADAALDLATRLNALFERWIRRAPEQWAWHQPRFVPR